MAIPQTNITWTSLKNEFGGDYPAGQNIHEGYYYRGSRVPDIAPNANVTNTGYDVSASSLRGAIKQQYFFSTYMFDLNLPDYSPSDYWYTIANGESGGIDGGYTECYSNSSAILTAPDIGYTTRLTVYGFSAYMAGGYRYTSDAYGTTYYKDRFNTPGLRLLSEDNSTVIASSDSTNQTEYWYDVGGGYAYVPGFSVDLTPNTTYHLKYKVNILNAGSGRDTFYFSGLPPYYFAAIK